MIGLLSLYDAYVNVITELLVMHKDFASDPWSEPGARIAESSVYSGLAKLFEINSIETVDVAERIVRQIAGYTADMALLDGSPDFRDLVLASLKRLQADTSSLIAHLEAESAIPARA